MNKKVWIIFFIVVIVILGGLVIWKRDVDNTNVDIDQLNPWQAITVEHLPDGEIPDHTDGSLDSKVTVIEYADYACIHCAELFPYIQAIQDEYRDRALFIYRNFSLGYPNSTVTQSAAEAAGLQGKFWEMHDQLFSDPTQWTGQIVTNRKEVLEGYASNVGLDIDKFRSDLEKPPTAVKNKIQRDKQLGLEAGVSGTPTFFVNGEKVELDSNGNSIRAAIDKALKK